MPGFGSNANNYKDNVQVGLECGHPYKKPGETCELCGKILPMEDANEQKESEG